MKTHLNIFKALRLFETHIFQRYLILDIQRINADVYGIIYILGWGSHSLTSIEKTNTKH